MKKKKNFLIREQKFYRKYKNLRGLKKKKFPLSIVLLKHNNFNLEKNIKLGSKFKKLKKKKKWFHYSRWFKLKKLTNRYSRKFIKNFFFFNQKGLYSKSYIQINKKRNFYLLKKPYKFFLNLRKASYSRNSFKFKKNLRKISYSRNSFKFKKKFKWYNFNEGFIFKSLFNYKKKRFISKKKFKKFLFRFSSKFFYNELSYIYFLRKELVAFIFKGREFKFGLKRKKNRRKKNLKKKKITKYKFLGKKKKKKLKIVAYSYFFKLLIRLYLYFLKFKSKNLIHSFFFFFVFKKFFNLKNLKDLKFFIQNLFYLFLINKTSSKKINLVKNFFFFFKSMEAQKSYILNYFLLLITLNNRRFKFRLFFQKYYQYFSNPVYFISLFNGKNLTIFNSFSFLGLKFFYQAIRKGFITPGYFKYCYKKTIKQYFFSKNKYFYYKSSEINGGFLYYSNKVYLDHRKFGFRDIYLNLTEDSSLFYRQLKSNFFFKKKRKFFSFSKTPNRVIGQVNLVNLLNFYNYSDFSIKFIIKNLIRNLKYSTATDSFNFFKSLMIKDFQGNYKLSSSIFSLSNSRFFRNFNKEILYMESPVFWLNNYYLNKLIFINKDFKAAPKYYYITVNETFRNIFVTLSDSDNKILYAFTRGSFYKLPENRHLKKIDYKRTRYYVYKQMARYLVNLIIKLRLYKKSIFFKLTNTATTLIKTSFIWNIRKDKRFRKRKLKVRGIYNMVGKAHNGCRLKKQKRL